TGSRGARPRRSVRQAGALPAPTQRWRTAACVHRSRLRQSAAHPAGRRAHRKPRPGNGRGDHAPARPNQQDRNHGGDGNTRPTDRQHDAQARDPTRPRHHRARPGQGRLRMISRLRYTLREMWASLTRNLTLTVAAVITSMVSLFLFGMTLLIQQAFDNQLSQWTGGVKMIVYVKNGAPDDAVSTIQEALESRPEIIKNVEYCSIDCSLSQAKKLFAADPESLKFLSAENIPSYFSVEPVDKQSIEQLLSIRQSFVALPGVLRADFPSDQITVLGKLKSFFGVRTYVMSGVLLFASVLLIWNTIRTAMV